MPITIQPTEALFQWPRWAFSCPERIALIHLSRSGEIEALTWGQLVQAVHELAGRVESLRLSPGDRIVHRMGNTLGGVLVALTSAVLGTIEVPLESNVDEPTLQAVARRVAGTACDENLCKNLAITPEPSGSDAVGSDAARSGAFAGQPPSVVIERLANALLDRQSRHDPQRPSLILMTSGTSGRSKAVTLGRQSLSLNAAAKLDAVPQHETDLRLTLLPLCHAYARTCDLGTWLISGSTLAVASGWDGWQRLAPTLRPTLVNTVPSIAMRLLELPTTSPAMSRLRLVGCGGAALPQDAFRRFQNRGITVIQGYGMTEAAPVICSATPDNARPGLVGRPVASWQTRVDADGRLSVRGPCVMIGYWNEDQTIDRFSQDQWLDTGDMVEVDPIDGQLRILGRADDRITLANGRKVYPQPIEQRLLAVASIRHAILVGNDRHTQLWIDVAPRTACGDELEPSSAPDRAKHDSAKQDSKMADLAEAI
jgi:long-chain acyl-CoA synthetase